MTLRLNRRTAMIAAAGSLAAPVLVSPAIAATETTPPDIAPWHNFRLGEFTVTPLLAGTRTLDDPHGTFGTNIPAETFAEVSAASFIPTDKSLNYFVPVMVETGSVTALFDTGLTPEGIVGALAAVGKTPGDIDIVVITHMHGDHVGGLMADETPTFPTRNTLPARRNGITGPAPIARHSTPKCARWPKRSPSSTTGTPRSTAPPPFRPRDIRRAIWPTG